MPDTRPARRAIPHREPFFAVCLCALAVPRRTRPSPSGAPGLSLRKKLLFSAVTVLLALVGLEMGARVVVGVSSNPRWDHHHNLMVDLGFPQLNELLDPDPVRFWKLRPSLANVPVAGSVAGSAPFRFRVSTDENGLRRTPYAPNARRRILLLGDSCLFGLGVNDDQTVAAHLQKLLPGVECVNAGVPGYSSYQGRVWLEELEALGPFDAVVVNFGRNDGLVWNDRGDAEQAEVAARERSRPLNRLRLVQLTRGLLQGGTQSSGPATGARSAERPRLTDDEFSQEITGIVGWARRNGAEPILLVWPVVQQMEQEGKLPKQYVTLATAARLKVTAIDLVGPLRAAGGTSLFLDVVHTNDRGCEAVAGALLEAVSPIVLAERSKR